LVVIVEDSDGLGNLRARDRGFCDGRQRVVVVVVVVRGRRRERLEWEGRNGARRTAPVWEESIIAIFCLLCYGDIVGFSMAKTMR
jgi:hypothetical protein